MGADRGASIPDGKAGEERPLQSDRAMKESIGGKEFPDAILLSLVESWDEASPAALFFVVRSVYSPILSDSHAQRSPTFSHLSPVRASFVSLGLSGCPSSTEEGTSSRPNIVLIMADDMGFSDLGSFGAVHIETPTLDSLATRGVRFADFYNRAKCDPTRA